MNQNSFNRREFLRRYGGGLGGIGMAHLLGGAALSLGQRGFAEPSSETTGRKFILGSPLTHSDWMLKQGMAWGEAGVRHMLDMCKAAGWSRIYWRAFDGGRSLYKSKLMRAQGKWDEDNYWNPQNAEDLAVQQRTTPRPNFTAKDRLALLAQVEALDYEHFDSLAAAVDYGHKIGLEIHAWVTINEDDHAWGIQSEFSKKHPEFRWRKRNGKDYRSQLSFAFPEVRKYKLGLLKELLGYDIDGFFFDWIRTGDVRDNPQTDAEGVADSGYEEPLVKKFKKKFDIDPHEVKNGDERWVRMRAEPQTEFVRAAHKLIRSHRRKIPISAMVAHPWHYRGEQNKIDGNLRGLLLDLTTWAREGLVDSVVAAGYHRDGGNDELAYQALKKETEGKVDVWPYAWVPYTVAQAEQTFALADKLGARQILYWEADFIDDRPNAAELKAVMSRRAAQ
ncbi:MAG: family 10 glycosylhydrolase [Verrucomicrobiota bacterium]